MAAGVIRGASLSVTANPAGVRLDGRSEMFFSFTQVWAAEVVRSHDALASGCKHASAKKKEEKEAPDTQSAKRKIISN